MKLCSLGGQKHFLPARTREISWSTNITLIQEINQQRKQDCMKHRLEKTQRERRWISTHKKWTYSPSYNPWNSFNGSRSSPFPFKKSCFFHKTKSIISNNGYDETNCFLHKTGSILTRVAMNQHWVNIEWVRGSFKEFWPDCSSSMCVRACVRACVCVCRGRGGEGRWEGGTLLYKLCSYEPPQRWRYGLLAGSQKGHKVCRFGLNSAIFSKVNTTAYKPSSMNEREREMRSQNTPFLNMKYVLLLLPMRLYAIVLHTETTVQGQTKIAPNNIENNLRFILGGWSAVRSALEHRICTSPSHEVQKKQLPR